MGTSSAQAKLVDIQGPSIIISGDYHAWKRVKLKRADGSKLLAISPGATHARRRSEPADHYVAVLYSDGSIKRVQLNSRVRLRFSVEDVGSFERLYETLPQALEEAYALASKRSLPPALQTPYLLIDDCSDLANVEKRLKAVIKDNVHMFYSRSLP